MQGHEAAVHPDTYKGQWNMRSRGADLAMARCCPPLTTWVIISFVRKEMMTDQVHDLGRGSNTGRRPHAYPTHRSPPAHHPLTTRSPPAPPSRQVLKFFIQGLLRLAQQRGLTFMEPREVIQGNPTRGVEELLTQVAANYAQYGSPLELVFCVLPDRGNSTYLYPAIKRWADTAGGVASQCVQVGKVVDRQKFGMTYAGRNSGAILAQFLTASAPSPLQL